MLEYFKVTKKYSKSPLRHVGYIVQTECSQLYMCREFIHYQVIL